MKTNATRGTGLLENFLAKKRIKVANKHIPEEKRKGRILDIGCGTTPMFLLETNFNEKHGIDPNVKDISQDNITLQRIDLEVNELPFENDFFDVVTMLAVFEHIEKENLLNLIKEINRVLKKDGRFILTTPCPWSDWILKAMSKTNLVSSEEVYDHKDTYNSKKIKKYLVKGGFEEHKIKTGYFEIFLNNKVFVDK